MLSIREFRIFFDRLSVSAGRAIIIHIPTYLSTTQRLNSITSKEQGCTMSQSQLLLEQNSLDKSLLIIMKK